MRGRKGGAVIAREDLLRAAHAWREALDPEGLRAAGLLPLSGEFAPTIYYPPLSALEPLDARRAFEGRAVETRESVAIYLHVPFCRSHCSFCHCAVSTSRSAGDRDAYIAALTREIDLYRERFGYERVPVRSALLGGGTPTDLAPAQLRRLLEIVRARFDFGTCRQWSCDVDVSTLLGDEGRERLAIMKDAGVGRLTIGAQSFDDAILEAMGRTHDVAEIHHAVANARRAGFEDVCLDVIYGYAGQSLATWAETIEAALSLEVEEVQLYRLKLLPYGRGLSRLGARHRAGAGESVPEGESLTMRLYATLRLKEAGYGETLTRVFARSPDLVSRYALDMYCLLETTVGFGVTASSSYQDRFIQNAKTLSEYHALVERGELPVSAGVVRSIEAQLRWALISPLKDWQVTREGYRARTGRELASAFRPRIDELRASGLLEEDVRGLRLSERGRFFADQICQQFYARELVPLPESRYQPGPLSPYRQ